MRPPPNSLTLGPPSQFTGLLGAGLLTDLICAFDRASSTFYTLAAIGSSVCGHRGITHGGLSAALLDETLGGAVYCLKQAGVIGRGPAFTAALDVSYKAPLPAGATVAVVAGLARVEGRTAWVSARVVSAVAVAGGGSGGGRAGAAAQPTTTLYSEGRALFVVPRVAWEAAQQRLEGADQATLAEDETEAGVERRVVHGGA